MLRVLLLCLGVALNSISLAQSNAPAPITSEQLDFYLLQAFHASFASERIALNHIGLQTQQQGEDFVISAVLEGYPAHRAGISRGDIIRAVNGAPYQPVQSFNPHDAGPPFVDSEAEYSLVLERGGDTLTVTVSPVFENLYDSARTATINSVQQFSAGNKVIGYIRLWALARTSNDLITFDKLIDQLAHCDGLIVDLRDAYGFLSSQHLDKFLPNRLRRIELQGNGSVHTQLAAESPSLVQRSYQKPIAVLINSKTRGGAELLALQLAKMDRVLTLGESTPGRIGDWQLLDSNGSKSIIYLPADDSLIENRQFEGVGVIPQQAVAYPVEQTTRNDPQFEAAFNALMGRI